MEISFDKVGFWYQPGTPFAFQALKDVSLTIPSGQFTAVIGHTGSGKSTLIQHLNALLKPTTGRVLIGDRTIDAKTSNKHLKPLRKTVGIVFQFPENQLFEETVLKDIAFGPQNFGVTSQAATEMAQQAAKQVGLADELLTRSPFELSGGQMRRVAIAGVLALRPDVLVLDEPTAGLDPRGRRDVMTLVTKLQREQQMTIVLITHQMDDVARYAQNVVVMAKGAVVKQGTPQTVFSDANWLADHQLALPSAAEFAAQLSQHGFHFDPLPLTEEALVAQLAPQLPLKGGQHNE
ncbi:energy-coupling factor ABC transporter ATP-binding protein [Secundilactobacillus kimchicus]|uniref:Energy-coupling factor transporter ATP-binding protein EcfA2 n=1 Tax=Secundilactobacillus kimchicus JCM 15530 TaxID=1302272 RepID=A0A0R1HZL7_9LACO|nr:energy-coupling factor ABC transporter ATP-binding protein [Secundilactobacillus kimchicus]KRK48962.1 cobalt transporter ATP-binding subunit [Secundilactobacillus kimchicus JCM 15530]